MRSTIWKTGIWTAAASAAALTMSATGALAQTTSAQAEEIANALKRYIDERILEPTPDLSLNLDGAIEVYPRGDHYAGIIPAGELVVSSDHDDVTVVFQFADPLTFEIRIDERGWYDTTYVVPSSMRLNVYEGGREPLEGDPSASATFRIGDQSGWALIVPEYETAIASEGYLADMSFQVDDMPGDFSLARFTYSQDSEEVDEGIFDSTFTADASGFLISVPVEDVLVEIGNIGLFGAGTGLNFPALVDFNTALNELIIASEEGADEIALMEDARTLLAETPPLMSDFQATYFLEGLVVRSPDGNFDLTGAVAGGSLTGLDSELASISLNLDIEGLALDPAPPFANLLPESTGYLIEIADIPTDALLTWIDNVLRDIPVMGEDSAFDQHMLPLYFEIAERGTALNVEDLYYHSDAGSLEFTGQMRPNPGALLGLTATAELVGTNLANLISAMGSIPDFDSEAAAGFALIQGLGAQTTNSDGEPVHTYLFEVTDDGSVTLNGNDFGPLIEQLQ
ncbi:MAG: hypothetical protein AAF414_10375 [Pseudomonadota bacterium]